MTPEEYREAGLVFDRVRDLPELEQAAALDAACSGNAELRAHLMRLLRADRNASGGMFLERRAMEEAARLLAPDAPLPAAGTAIGNYSLVKRIGAGGMGVVFEGQDLRLHRRVAIKILTLPLGGEQEDLVKRFQREARAASQLNHPNILSIFDADFDQGHYYIATEFVEGKTLRQLAAEGIPDRKALVEIAIQLCSALDAAHQAGIVHRDIKPDNVMVRPDGIVKVLDFGLAKLVESAQRPESRYSSTADVRTRPGSIAGTVQYLSPEQVMGKSVGPRSDIFSAGILLFELAFGARPFDGATDGAIFANIVSNPPARPVAAGRPTNVDRASDVDRPINAERRIDADLEAIILRALEKDPDLRFQTAADLRAALKRLTRDSTISAVSSSSSLAPAGAIPRKPRKLPVAAIALAAVVAACFASWRMGAGWKRLPPLPAKFERITDGPGEELFPCLSPDGKQFIYSSAARGKWDIYLQRIGGEKAINLTTESADDDSEPALSPDGRRIAFRSEREGGGLFVMEATGENPRRISEQGYMPAWSPDGKAIVYSDADFTVPSSRRGATGRLYIVDVAAGTQRKLATDDAAQPNWSPHGDRIAYWGSGAGMQRDIYTVGAGNGAVVQVTSDPAVDWNPVWSPAGDYLYFLSDRGGAMNLWRIRIEERSGKTRGEPEPVTTPADSMAYLSFSADGRSFAYAQTSQRTNLFRVDYNASRKAVDGEPALVGSGAHNITVFSFSPDDSRLVYDAVGDIQEDLWVMNSDGSGRRRLTDDAFKDRSPAWSPKGDEIVFMSDRSGMLDEWTIRPDGSGLQRLTATAEAVQRPVWSADGKRVLASRVPGLPSLLDPHPASPATDLTPLPGLENFSGAIFSPFPAHGGLLAGEWFGEKGWEVIFYDLAKGVVTRSGALGRRPAYMPGDRQIVFGRGSKCLLYDLDTGREKELFSVGANTIYEIHPTHDGKRIFFTQTIRDADLWLARMGR